MGVVGGGDGENEATVKTRPRCSGVGVVGGGGGPLVGAVLYPQDR